MLCNTLSFYILFLFCSVSVCTVVPVSASGLGILRDFAIFSNK